MATKIPVPIEFALPEGWQPAPPDAVGASGSGFVALHSGSVDDGFTANITVSGDVRAAETQLSEIGEESLRNLNQAASAIRLEQRGVVGSLRHPGLSQLVRMAVRIGQEQREIVQTQVFLVMPDADPERRAVLQFVFTATPAQHDKLTGHFNEFLKTVRPEHASTP